MRAGIHHLLTAGAGVIVMPCNTAHYWYDALTADLPVPFIHIADAAVRTVQAPKGERIAVLGTSATLKLGMYQTRLAAAGWRPHDVEGIEDLVARAISEVKAGAVAAAAARLAPVLEQCFAEGAAQVVLACTELPIAASHAALPHTARVRLVDPTDAVAKAAVAWWLAQVS
jgi:aspartate racemase